MNAPATQELQININQDIKIPISENKETFFLKDVGKIYEPKIYIIVKALKKVYCREKQRKLVGRSDLCLTTA